MCNKCLWVETCPGACNKPWEGERWGERWCGACCNASFYALTEKNNHMDRPFEWPAELIDRKWEDKPPEGAPGDWKEGGTWATQSLWNQTIKKTSLSWSSSLTSFPLWERARQEEGEGGKEHWIFSFIPQKPRCWTCYKFYYVQKGAPNLFGLFLPSLSRLHPYHIEVH